MDSFFAFLSNFVDRLGLWVSVQPEEEAIRVRSIPWKEQRVDVFKPGIAWRLPFVDRILKEKVKRRTIDLTNISVETKDGTPYVISITLPYYVHNLKRALLECENFDTSLCVDTQRIVVAWANENLAPLSVAAMTLACQEPVRLIGLRYGCTVEAIGSNSFVRHRVYRLMVDNQ